MIGLAVTAWSFLRGNWSWALPIVGMIALGAWGGWQYLGRVQAEDALAKQQLEILKDANAIWADLNRKREDFEREVIGRLAALRTKVEAVHAANEEFQKKVDANANSSRALDPVERGALRMLDADRGNQAGGGAVRPADQSPRVRR